jgi:Ca2+-binding RTX toxin-like protein
VIAGLGGADRIDGRGGDDVICGGANRGTGAKQLLGDDIDGGPGSDWIDPGRDRRPVSAQGTADILRYSRAATGIQADLSGRSGTVVVGSDTDTIRVAEGLWVLGSQHDDVITGTRFDDDLEGNKGADLLQGGPGDDGIDELVWVFSRPDRHVDRKMGGDGDDRIQANGGADVLDGGTGDDFLYEQAGEMAATMLGGTGDDELLGWYDGAPGRTFDGGEGSDLIEIDNIDPDDPAGTQLVLDAGLGNVRSSLTTLAPLPVTGVERWRPVAAQRVVFLGSAGPDRVDATLVEQLSAQTFAGDDVVKGSFGPDTIDAGDGTDKVAGRGGQDSCVNGEQVKQCEG